jgi:hypothetical protein
MGGGVDQVGSYGKAMGDGSQSGMSSAALGAAAVRNGAQISQQNAGKISEGLGKIGNKFRGGGKGGDEGGDGPKLPTGPTGGGDSKKGDTDSKPEGDKPVSEAPKNFAEAKAQSPLTALKSSVASAIGGSNGSDEQKTSAAENAAKAFKSLDGRDMPGFVKTLQAKIASNPAANPDKSVTQAYNSTVDGKFGQGTGTLIEQASKGHFNSASESLMDKYKEKHGDLMAQVGDTEAKSLIKGANIKSIGEFKNEDSSIKNGGNLSLREFMTKNLEQVTPAVKEETTV